MFKFRFSLAETIKLICSASLMTLSAFIQAADSQPDAAEILKKADSYRLQSSSAKVVSEVHQFESGNLKKAHLYNVYLSPERKSLVVFKAASEQGQKMLMLDDKYWLLMPNSRRPIRITPMQKLLGEASVGDVSTLTWSEDYEGKILEETSWEGKPAVKLLLSAKTTGASYHKIELWVDAENYFPLQADLYLKSGKLAKIATFASDTPSACSTETDCRARRVDRMTLKDKIQVNQKTVIFYKQTEARTLPEKYYNPAYLSRQSVEHL